MKPTPIIPARIEFSDVEPPRSPQFGDIYHPRVGAFEQARHVFIAGNQLPQRWAGRERFAILETGFGLGNNFLATWSAWRNDPQRCERLLFASIEAHPPILDDLRRAHADSPLAPLARQLIAAWPRLVAGFHAIDLDGGRMRLLLVWGDVALGLRQLRGHFDAFYLDGFAPARNPEMWEPRVLKALARLAAPAATLATWSVARALREGLVTAGFELQRVPGIGGKQEVLRASFAPRPGMQRSMARPAAARDVIVIGAGLAGAWAAHALARQGLRVTVLERRASVAAETSGNRGGLWHGTLHPDDGPHARLHRAAALLVSRQLPGRASGLLRVETRLDLAAMRRLISGQRLPADYVQALAAEQASALAAVPVAHPAWFYPGGGWVDPRALVGQLLTTTGVDLRLSCDALRLRKAGGRWCVETAALAFEADALVLAGGQTSLRLLPSEADAAWPVEAVRGQVTLCSPGQIAGNAPHIPLSGDGYALRLPDGSLLCGASSSADDPDPNSRRTDHTFNLERLQRLTGLCCNDASACEGRVGWRLQTPDRLPIVGAVGLASPGAGSGIDQVRRMPRIPGLFVSTAFGARGIAMAALGGELLAAQMAGAPWPFEAELADAIDPTRWRVRATRRDQRGVDGSAAG